MCTFSDLRILSLSEVSTQQRIELSLSDTHHSRTHVFQVLGEIKKNDRGSLGASSKYQKLTQLEHVLVRPDTYIGSVEHISDTMVV
jgi:hypothetical protein